MSEKQGIFTSIFDRLTPPPVSYDREPHGTQAAGLAYIQTAQQERDFVAKFISKATPFDRKFTIHHLIDRGVEVDGLAPELEDALCAIKE